MLVIAFRAEIFHAVLAGFKLLKITLTLITLHERQP